MEFKTKDIIFVPLSEIKLNPKNRNKHNEQQIGQFVKILRANGFRNPGIISNQSGLLVAGEGRYLALKKIGATNMPIMYQDFESPEQEYQVGISDNAIAAQAVLDLSTIHVDIQEMGPFDLDLLGIKDFQLEPNPETNEDPDAVPATPKTAKTKRGELWVLGNHRLLVDDCTMKENVERLMGGEKADMVHTDPPYGVDYEGVTNDHHKGEKLREFLSSAFKSIDCFMRDGACFYVWHPDIHAYEFIGATKDAGWQLARPAIIQWLKNSLVLSQGDYHSRNEPCLYGWKPGAGHKRVEDRTQDTIWEFDKPSRSEEHPTMKPVELCERAIQNSSEPNWAIADLFLGSGSTLIACEKINRRCFGCEIEPIYSDVIIQRWEKFTGKEAVREDGKLFSEI